jgi:hypothetical protein
MASVECRFHFVKVWVRRHVINGGHAELQIAQKVVLGGHRCELAGINRPTTATADMHMRINEPWQDRFTSNSYDLRTCRNLGCGYRSNCSDFRAIDDNGCILNRHTAIPIDKPATDKSQEFLCPYWIGARKKRKPDCH